MTRVTAVAALTLCSILLLAGLATAADLAPVSAAEAEKRAAESRDALTEMLWVGMDPLWHEGKGDECVRLSREIIGIDPHFVEAYTGAAWLLWSAKRDEEATALYQQGLAANPDSPDLYFDFGFFLRDRKKYDQAIAMFRKANETGIIQAKRHMLPNTLEEAGHKREALAEWRALLKRFPGDPVAKMKAARLAQELKQQQ